MSRRVGPSEQGQLQGANTSLFGVAGMVAPLVFSQLFAVSVPKLPGAPFWLASLLLLGSVVTVWFVFRGAMGRTTMAEAAD